MGITYGSDKGIPDKTLKQSAEGNSKTNPKKIRNFLRIGRENLRKISRKNFQSSRPIISERNFQKKINAEEMSNEMELLRQFPKQISNEFRIKYQIPQELTNIFPEELPEKIPRNYRRNQKQCRRNFLIRY